MAKINIQEEIRRITSETTAVATAKALEVAEQAKQKAAEVASLAIAKALEAATLAATKAADAASAAATIAVSTGKDLEYMRKALEETKVDIKSINDKLDNKYVSKEEFKPTKDEVADFEAKFVTKESFAVVKGITYGLVGIVMTSVVGGLMYMLINKPN